MAKVTEHVRGVLAANRRLAHYTGITKRPGKPDRPYDIISSAVTVYRASDGHLVDPESDEVRSARSERHSVAFDPATWDAIAGVACVTDTIIVEGTLVQPEQGEDGYYEVERADKSRFLGGDLKDPMPVKHIPGVFRGGLLRKSDEIRVTNTLDSTVQ